MHTIREMIFGLNVYESTAKTMRKMHRHSDIQLGFYEKGPVKYQIGDRSYTINSMDYVLCWAEIPHILLETPENNIQRWLTVPLALFMQWNLPDEISKDILEGKLLSAREEAYNNIDITTYPQWKKDLENEDILYNELIAQTFEARFKRFFLLYKNQKDIVMERSYKENSVFANIYEYLRKNFTKRISINEIAKSCNIHPHYAMAVFKKKSGYTINNMINLLRINEAKRLLISSELTVLDIAYEAGFLTMSNFYSSFKKQCGITPIEYRKNPFIRV